MQLSKEEYARKRIYIVLKSLLIKVINSFERTYLILSHDVEVESVIKPCIKNHNPLGLNMQITS